MTKTKTVEAKTEVDETNREITQIVSVFGNEDSFGDVVRPGAFAASIEAWEASGDPLPVYFSHQWGDPFACIGEVKEAAELLPGDERLPEPIKDLGGLMVTYAIDDEGENKTADQIYRLLTKRRVKQASFAYEVVASQRNEKEGYTELLELNLLEVGPTLRGANQLTTTLKSDDFSEDEQDEQDEQDEDSDDGAETSDESEQDVTQDNDAESEDQAEAIKANELALSALALIEIEIKESQICETN